MASQERSYLEQIKAKVVTDPKSKQPISGRTQKLRDELLNVLPKICSERARLYTESWKETEGQPLVIRRAKAFDKVLREMSIFIRPNELLVGNQASDIRAAPVFPEFEMQFIPSELDGKPYRFEERPGERYWVSEEDEKELRQLAEWWKGKSMAEYKRNLYPNEVRKAIVDVGVLEIYIYGEGGGSGHLIEDFPKILHKGYRGLMEEAEEHLRSLNLWEPSDFLKKDFLEAVVMSLKSAIAFTRRYAALARELAEKEPNTRRKTELLQIADHCEWLPDNPPRNFWEALQLVWFTHLLVQIESSAQSISFGRFDQYMYQFYEKDIDSGSLTHEEAVELIESFLIKCNELNKIRDWGTTRFLMGYQLFQQLTVGGQTTNQQSAVNDLSFLILEATENLKLDSPSLSVRYWDNIPENFLMKCVECINVHRGGMPQMHNDEILIPALTAFGVSLNEAYDYAIIGCEEPGVPGRSTVHGNSCGCNILKALEMTLNDGKDPRTGIKMLPNLGNKDLSTFGTFEEVMAAYKRQQEYFNRLAIIGLHCLQKAYADMTPTPFTSAFVDDCIKLGKDIEWGGIRYNPIVVRGIGIANIGNSLAAIKKIVFEDKLVTGAELLHALETDFEDNTTKPTGEDIMRMLLSVPKFGNDDDYVDSLTRQATDYMVRDVPNYLSLRGGKGAVALLPVTQNVPFGQACGATPDGRKAGTPSADGVSPTQGTDKKGPTAAVKSAAKLNHVGCIGGTLLNQKISPQIMNNMAGLRKLAALIRTYFDFKGQHIQFNIVSADTLRDAQLHPEQYSDLMVRVAGYSAHFTPLDPDLQNDIIARTEQTF